MERDYCDCLFPEKGLLSFHTPPFRLLSRDCDLAHLFEAFKNHTKACFRLTKLFKETVLFHR